MAGELDGRVVLVFGAGSSGIAVSNGEASARAYGLAGAKVVAIDRDPAEAERVAEQIVCDGGQAIWLRADVMSEGDVRRAVGEAGARWGPPHVLHNNVGVAVDGSVLDLSRDRWDDAMAVNVTSIFLTAKHVVPLMLEAGRGVIVNMSSTASIRDTGYVYPAYSASKAAVNQLTVSLALTYANRGIRANAIVAGLIDTPLVRQQIKGADESADAVAKARDAMSPTGKVGTPWDVAHAAVFLASDAAAYINGVCLPVDGGLAARCR